MNLREIIFCVVNWTELARVRIQLRAFAITAISLRVPEVEAVMSRI
jgi:hypothetical protein